MNALLTDLYQLTMMQGLFKQNKHGQLCVFDRFYRKNPFGGAYAVAAGLDHVIEYILNLKFTEDDIQYLRAQAIFDEDFLEYLQGFKFSGDIYAVPDGTITFAKDILVRVEATLAEGLLIETALSMFMNHESLIATKARRVRSVVGDDNLAEFGLRRAQGQSAANYGARAAMIGGFNSTSNVQAGKEFGLAIIGTMAHSWVMSFDSEEAAFRAYANQYPNNLILLVDTYDTLEQGVPNAIKIFDEIKLKNNGKMPIVYGIRLDSGDLAYLSVEARKMLDNAGYETAIISASNDLDEYIIADLKRQGAKIDSWGVGTKLITANGTSALGGVYKLAGYWTDDGTFEPKMKFSDNIEKITNPGRKKMWRFIYKDTNKIVGDLIALENEEIDIKKDFNLYNPFFPWKKKQLVGGTYRVEELLVPIFKSGKLVYNRPTLKETISYANEQAEMVWHQFFRLVNPPENRVYISKTIWELRQKLMRDNGQVSE